MFQYKHTLLLIMCFGLYQGMGQSTFNKTYDFLPGWDYGMALVVDDSTYTMLVQSPTTTNSILSLFTLNTDGDSLRSATIVNYPSVVSAVSDFGGGSLLEASDSSLLVCGAHSLDTINGTYDSTISFLYLMSKQGDSIWYQNYGTVGDKFTAFHQVLKENNGEYTVFGVSDMINSNLNNDLYLLRVDGVGNILWQKFIGDGRDEDASNFKKTPDGGYILGGAVQNGIGDWSHLLIKVDGAGNQEWRKEFGTVNGDEYKGYVSVLSDSNYLLVGSTRIQGQQWDNAFVAKLDQNGDTLWTNNYGGINSQAFAVAPLELANKSILISGVYHDTIEPNGVNAWLVNIDQHGELQWDRLFNTYGGINHNYITDIEITSDNSILLCGRVSSFPPTKWYAWVAKLDSNGCDSIGCPTYYHTDPEVPDTNTTIAGELNVMMYPNPSNDEVNFSLSEDLIGGQLTMYTSMGQVVYHAQLDSDQLTIGVSTLSAGVYLVCITDQLGRVVLKKLMVW